MSKGSRQLFAARLRTCMYKEIVIYQCFVFLSSSSPVWFSSFVFKCVCYYYTPFVFLFFVFLLQLWLLFVAEIIITQPNQKHCPTSCRAQTRKRLRILILPFIGSFFSSALL